jgi:hypothetical protein
MIYTLIGQVCPVYSHLGYCIFNNQNLVRMILNVPLLSGKHWALALFLTLFSFTSNAKSTFNYNADFSSSSKLIAISDLNEAVQNENRIIQCDLPGSSFKVMVEVDLESGSFEVLNDGTQSVEMFSPDCHGNCDADSDPFCDDEDILVNWSADGYYNGNFMVLKDSDGNVVETVNLPSATSGQVNFGIQPPGSYTAELNLNYEGVKDVCSFDVTDCGFEFDCYDGVKVDVYGAGNGNCSANPDITVDIPDPGNVYEVTIEVVYKSSYPGSSVQIKDNNGTTHTLPQVYQSNWSSWVYRKTLTGSYSYFTHDNETSSCGSSGVQSMVVYAFRNVSEPQSQVGIFSENSGYNNVKYVDLEIPTDTDPRDITVSLPISELTNDGRYMKITATSEINGAADQSATTYICGPDQTLNNCCLDFVEIAIPNVSANANNVEIKIDTRNGEHSTGETGCSSTSGQSWILAGIVLVDLECEFFKDWGDNPESYGEICVDIDSGSPAFLGTIGDHEDAMQHSTQANGDDADGNDDEDGVTFVGGTTLTGGTTEQITISWETEDHDSYISGWIDFNRDGDFDSNEKVIDDYQVGSCCGTATGSHNFNITVPSTAKCGVSYSRFLIVSDENEGPTGYLCDDPSGNDGEVEDYKVVLDGNLMVMMPPAGEICEGDEIVLTVSASGGSGNYTFDWSHGLGTGTSKTVNPTTSTTYTVTVTDDVTGCTDDGTVTVTVTPNPEVDAGPDKSYCLDDGNNSVTLTAVGTGGTGTLSYSWSNGYNGASQTVSPDQTKNYSVTVTDEKFCYDIDYVTVYVHPNPTANAGPDQSYCLDDGSNSVTLTGSATGGTPGYSYSWNQGLGNGQSKTVSPDVTTTYTLTVIDDEGCEDTDQVTVYVHENPTANAGPDQSICLDDGSNTVILTAGASGGTPVYSYTWNQGLGAGQSHTVSPNTTTTYTVTVIDDKGCEDTDQVTVYVHPNPTANAGPNQSICLDDGSNTVTLTASAAGGSPGYSYTWNQGLGAGQSHTVSPNTTTTYTVTVIDDEGCEDTDQVTVYVHPNPTANAGPDQSYCLDDGSNSVTLTASASGGTPGYTYSWNQGLGNGQSKTVSPDVTTTYTLSVIDDEGCEDTDKVTVFVHPNPSVDLGPDDAICYGKNYTLIASVTGGSPNYSYQWTPNLGNSNTHTVSPTSTTTYYVTVTDSEGCTGTDQITIFVNPNPSVDLGVDATICEDDSYTLTAEVTGGTPEYDYTWNPYLGNSNTHSVTPIQTTTYYVTVTDANGCEDYDQVTLTVEPCPSCCDYIDKPAFITLQYTGESCVATVTEQDPDKYSCTGNPNFETEVYIIANDKSNPNDGYIWFEGYVNLGDYFSINAALAGEDKLKSETHIHIFDEENGNLLQQVEFHTSCSQPINLNDQYGSIKIVYILDDHGDECGDFLCEIDPGVIAEDEEHCGPFDPEEIYSVEDASVEYVPAASQDDCCVDGFKPAVLTMKYTGQSCSSTQTTQDDGKWNCDGDPAYDSQVYIIANDDNDPYDNDNVWFAGTVNLDDTYEIDAANAGENKLKSNTVIHIFDHQGGSIIQTVNFHTSCSQPLGIGDQWGANKLLLIVAENGESCEDESCDLEYAWEYRTTGDWTLIQGATSSTYDPPYITETTQYRRLASHCVCGEVISNVVTKTVYPEPVVNAGEDQAYCLDDGFNSVILFANATGGTPEYTYTWNKGLGNGQAHTVSPDVTTLYRVTVTDDNGCQDTDDVLVTVYQNPDVELGLNKTICTTQSTTLTASVLGGTPEYTYEWLPDLGNAPSHTVSPTQTTTYYVTVTDEHGCQDHDQVTVLVEPCDDIQHNKQLTDIVQTGPRKFRVEYQIEVSNTGQSPGMYDLQDQEGFDDDIEIQSVNFTSDVTGNPGGNLNLSGPWLLANDQEIGVGESHTYTMNFFVELDLKRPVPLGDGVYTPCGYSDSQNPDFGEGLYNQSKLDYNNDGQWDEYSEDCGDLPFVTHEKFLDDIVQTGARSWKVYYHILVRNEAAASGHYDLDDYPNFDNDIQITNANYTSNAPGVSGGTLLGDGPWTLANNTNIAGWGIHDYYLEVDVLMDLNSPNTPGDGYYKACESSTPGDPKAGEGLYNFSALDVNNDGQYDEDDEVCGDIPFITHEKTLDDIVQTGARTWEVTYDILVENKGGATGKYDLWDEPGFDNDIEILEAYHEVVYDCPAGGPAYAVQLTPALAWQLENNKVLQGGEKDCHTMRFIVKLDLKDPATFGDGFYTACESFESGDPEFGEGLYNQSKLDVNDDGSFDEYSEDCGDIPDIHHDKTFNYVVANTDGSYQVFYDITVTNYGGATGEYNLTDVPQFDDDFVILDASYSSDVPSSGPLSTSVPPGIWILGEDVSLGAGQTHTYTIEVKVDLDLDDPNSVGDEVYTPCESEEPGYPQAGEGLFNQSFLDVNDDDTPDETDKVCGDIPALNHEKHIDDIVRTGPYSWDVYYHIIVRNEGGAAGEYNLWDQPDPDNDVVITAASYTSNAPGVAGGSLSPLAGPWTLGSDVAIADGAIHYYNITVSVTMNLNDPDTPGDGIYDACESETTGDPRPNEGLYNQSFLDIDDDGQADETDEACGDIPFITHEKTLDKVVQVGPDTWDVYYDVNVKNLGGAASRYDLFDEPGFDDDIQILEVQLSRIWNCPVGAASAEITTDPAPWQLADNRLLAPGKEDCHSLKIRVKMDLEDPATPGDGIYTACESEIPGDPDFGEGLYNQSKLDINDDGQFDEYSEVCGDLPSIHHEKHLLDIEQTAKYTYKVQYEIVVTNDGGTDGTYNLEDEPGFDNDVVIIGASYSSDAPGNAGGGLGVNNPGPYTLASDQDIAQGAVHTYTLTIYVLFYLDGSTPGGDGIYTECASTTPGDPQEGEGLYNQSKLDINDDGEWDEYSEACGDIPFVTHDKYIDDIVQSGTDMWDVNYRIVVKNLGGALGHYTLRDAPDFDDDISIVSADYSSDAPGVSGGTLAGIGPWILASDVDIDAGGVHTFWLTIRVQMDLTLPTTPGDGEYSTCESETPGSPSGGEGLFNRSSIDVNDDGDFDEHRIVCDDIPNIYHEKTLFSIDQTGTNTYKVHYSILVINSGGVAGHYSLQDAPAFDDDVQILNVIAFQAIDDYIALPPVSGYGPYDLADNQVIFPQDTHYYDIVFDVLLDLNAEPLFGDGIYTECESETSGDPSPGEGLFNESRLDKDGDDQWDEYEEACGDLPFITHHKTVHTAPVELPNGNFEVKYKVEVRNLGGAPGTYSLNDMPEFDDDVEILSVSYNSSNGGENGNPVAPSTLPWVLATDHGIGAYPATHTYVVTVELSIDLEDEDGDNFYDFCADNGFEIQAGHGLFNRSVLYSSEYGVIEKDSACTDVVLGSIGDFVFYDRNQNGLQDPEDPGFNVAGIDLKVYLLDGGKTVIDSTTVDANGYYLFSDLSAGNYYVKFAKAKNYDFTTHNNPADDALDSDANPLDGLSDLIVLASGEDNMTIDAGFKATIRYKEICDCLDNASRKGDGQFNEEVAITGYPDETWTIIQRFGVFKRQPDSPNPPGTPVPVALGTEFENDPSGSEDFAFKFMHVDDQGYTLTATNGNGSNLAIDNVCSYPEVQYYTYQEVICTTDEPFDLFGFANIAGEVKFYYNDQQVTEIDPLVFGIGEFALEMIVIPDDPEECIAREYTAIFKVEECEEMVTHYKELVSVDRIGTNFKATYNIYVENTGLDVSDYDLFDAPDFDDDIQILQASYTSNAPGISGGSLNGYGPWQLANDQEILPGVIHTYTVEIYLRMNLASPYTPGDGVYSACNSNEVEYPVAGEGLFNESRLDLDEDGNWEETSVACGDIPDIHHEKFLNGITNNPDGTYNVEYLIKVRNHGGAEGSYNLKDKPEFDDDIEILDASFNSTVPSNANLPAVVPVSGWTLASDQVLAGGAYHDYFVTVHVELDLSDPNSPGDEIYNPCNSSIPGDPVAGEGLYNASYLDVNDDGQPDEEDEACGDLEIIDMALTIEADSQGPFLAGQHASFTIKVYNQSNVPVKDVEIVDYVSIGYDWLPAENPGWSYNGAFATYTVPGTILPGDYAIVNLDLEVATRTNYELEDWIHYAEILNIYDLNGINKNNQEADSTPGSDTAYERNVQPGDPWDNVITGSGPPQQDEDDHDPAKVEVALSGSIGDKVWMDDDGDGVQDPGEPGVENVKVRLFTCQHQFVAEMYTDAAGIYRFEEIIAGSYYVQFDIATLPPNTSWTTPNQSDNDNLDSDAGFDGRTICTTIEGGETDNSWDAGIIELANVGNFVWEDINGDGIQNIGENGIPGVLVILYRADGTLVAQQYTDASGHYLFTGVFPGDYYLKFIQPNEYSDVTFPGILDDNYDSDVDGSNGTSTTTVFHLGSGETDLKWDAGYYKCADIGSLVWCDYELNDVWDDDENGINGLKVVLYKYSGGYWNQWDYTYTGHKPGTPSDDGYWNICVPPGTYYAEFRMPVQAGMVIAEPNLGDDENRDSDITGTYGYGTTDQFTVFSGDELMNLGAGYSYGATLTGKAWFDSYKDGQYAADEVLVSSVLVEAFNEAGEMMGDAYTNNDGEYEIIGLRAEEIYYLRFYPPLSYGFTIANSGDDATDSDVDEWNGPGTTAFYGLLQNEVKYLDAGLIQSVLPVEMEAFWGENRKVLNYLEWTTVLENNSDKYIVERRLDTEDRFVAIGEVDAIGSSINRNTYDFEDYDVERSGVYYYRLRLLDQDGLSTFSNTIVILIEKELNGELSVYPNPCIDQFNIDLDMEQESRVEVDILDAKGRLVMDAVVEETLTSGIQTLNIRTDELTNGMYNIRIVKGNKVINRKLVVLK